MRDETALRRHLVLLRTLSSRRYGLTIQEMADESGVAAKTIRRDLDLFRSLGFDLEESVGEFGRKTWKITTGSNPVEASSRGLLLIRPTLADRTAVAPTVRKRNLAAC